MAVVIHKWALDGCCYFLMGSRWLSLFVGGLEMVVVFCGRQHKSLQPYKCKPWPCNAAKWHNSCGQAA